MSASKERATAILTALTAQLPDVLRQATLVAIRDSSPTQMLVLELGSLGYQLDAELECALRAVPVEMVFERALTEDDREFLRLPNPDQ